MSTPESHDPATRRALQKAFDPARPPESEQERTTTEPVRRWGDEGIEYVPPSKGNNGQNAGE